MSENITFNLENDNICSPTFTLSCTSNGGPVKRGTWSRGSVIQSRWTPSDNVTMYNLTVTDRRGGRYQCTLENGKPSMITKNFKVKGIST